jgi:SH3-like domain-containing protein
LPLLLAVEALKARGGEFPVLVVLSVEEYRLVWDVDGTTRYVGSSALTRNVG